MKGKKEGDVLTVLLQYAAYAMREQEVKTTVRNKTSTLLQCRSLLSSLTDIFSHTLPNRAPLPADTKLSPHTSVRGAISDSERLQKNFTL